MPTQIDTAALKEMFAVRVQYAAETLDRTVFVAQLRDLSSLWHSRDVAPYSPCLFRIPSPQESSASSQTSESTEELSESLAVLKDFYQNPAQKLSDKGFAQFAEDPTLLDQIKTTIIETVDEYLTVFNRIQALKSSLLKRNADFETAVHDYAKQDKRVANVESLWGIVLRSHQNLIQNELDELRQLSQRETELLSSPTIPQVENPPSVPSLTPPL